MIKRTDFVKTVQKLSIKTAYMEACSSANHWHRTLKQLGIDIKLISPQYVKSFVKTNKTDANMQRQLRKQVRVAICVLFLKNHWGQQDIQSLLKIRERLKNNRTRLITHLDYY